MSGALTATLDALKAAERPFSVVDDGLRQELLVVLQSDIVGALR
jgi:hypothetical protein